jgi:hypothetical protein
MSVILVATGTISTSVTQHVAAQNISIPTNTTQQANCDTAGSSSAVADSCNDKSTNNIANSGGVVDLNTQHKHHHHTTITVIKQVINDNGGTLQASDFTIRVITCGAQGKHIVASFPGDESGTTVELDPAPCYFLHEDTPANSPGYDASFTGDCSTLDPQGESNRFPLNEGDHLTCTITNNDVPPTITVTKHVINDNGGTLQASDVTIGIYICGTSSPVVSFPGSESGTTVPLDPAPCYAVVEFIPPTPTGYDVSRSGDCTNSAGQGVGFPLNPGDQKTCTFTNNDRP